MPTHTCAKGRLPRRDRCPENTGAQREMDRSGVTPDARAALLSASHGRHGDAGNAASPPHLRRIPAASPPPRLGGTPSHLPPATCLPQMRAERSTALEAARGTASTVLAGR